MRWPKLAAGDLVLIWWHDAVAHDGGWVSRADAIANTAPAVQVTAGLFVSRDRHSVCVARSMDQQVDTGDLDGCFQVPLGCVTRCSRIRKKEVIFK